LDSDGAEPEKAEAGPEGDPPASGLETGTEPADEDDADWGVDAEAGRNSTGGWRIAQGERLMGLAHPCLPSLSNKQTKTR
jgi:hypothetical protein